MSTYQDAGVLRSGATIAILLAFLVDAADGWIDQHCFETLATGTAPRPVRWVVGGNVLGGTSEVHDDDGVNEDD